MSERPKRKVIPKRIKAAVRAIQTGLCGCRKRCGAQLPPDGNGLVEYQHEPALALREVNSTGTDYVPPQHDPKYIFAELKACHRAETNKGRSGATTVGSDRHAINKAKWIRGEFKGRPKTKWAKGRRLQGRPFQKRAKT